VLLSLLQEVLEKNAIWGQCRADARFSRGCFLEPDLMRRIALMSLTLMVGGCGYNTWWNPPFSTGSNPNEPIGGA